MKDKELEWMPLYWDRFMKGTSHMNAAQIGAYILLIHEQWYKGFVPTDKAKLKQIARLGRGRESDENLSVILEKFTRQENDVFINNTCLVVKQEQLEKYTSRSERATKAVKAREEKRALDKHKITTSSPQDKHSVSDNRVLSKDNTIKGKKEMPSAEFEKIILANEDDYLWMEELIKKFQFQSTYEANQQVNFAYRKHIREKYLDKGESIYFEDAKHIRNSAVVWYIAVKKQQAIDNKKRMVW
jgi:uncharacterized protein YdaU (DUF1376 family)